MSTEPAPDTGDEADQGLAPIGRLRRLASFLLAGPSWFFRNVASPIVAACLLAALLYAAYNRGAVRVLAVPAGDAALALELDRGLDAVAAGAQTGVNVDASLHCDSVSGPPPVAIPGTNLTVEALLGLFQWGPLRRTEIRVMLTDERRGSNDHAYRMHIEVEGPNQSPQTIETDVQAARDAAFISAAETLYAVLEPTVAAYYFHQRAPDRSLQLVDRILHDKRSTVEDEASGYHVWGLVLRDQGDYDGALGKLEQAVRKIERAGWVGTLRRKHARSRLARLYVDIGYVHTIERHWEDAAAAFATAAEADDTWAVPLNVGGDALRELGRLDEAADLYQKASAVDPNSPDAWHGLGMVRHAQGADARAVEALVSARRLSLSQRKQASMSYALGELFRGLGCQRTAAGEWDRAVALDPAQGEARPDWRMAQACRPPTQDGRAPDTTAACLGLLGISPSALGHEAGTGDERLDRVGKLAEPAAPTLTMVLARP